MYIIKYAAIKNQPIIVGIPIAITFYIMVWLPYKARMMKPPENDNGEK